MDPDRFDALSRALSAVGSRRGALASVLAGALALVDGQEAAASKSLKQCKKIDDKKRRKRCIKKAKKQSCPSSSPIECGSGCCSRDFPICCAAADPANSVCASQHFQCCPVETTGGGTCPIGTTCCPPRKGTIDPACIQPTLGGQCCPFNSGGRCFPRQHCCPPEKTNDANFGCCDDPEPCCNADADCNVAAGERCSFGCCSPF
jgi:hypothetical protein